jgi:Carboxypeptidase regulatory-like domain
MRAPYRIGCRLILVYTTGLYSIIHDPVRVASPPVELQLRANPEKSETCSISGRIERAGTNEPITRAQVDLSPLDKGKDLYRAFSDTSGQFSIESVEAGRYQLVVNKSGYLAQSYGQDLSGTSGAILTLDPGKKMGGLLFRMIPWGVISGRVTDEDNQPVSDVQVVALQSRMSEGKRKLFAGESAQTNDRGEYRLYRLTKGHYYIRVEYADRQKSDHPVAGLQMGFPAIYYPGSSSLAHAVAVDISPGQEVSSVDLRLVPARAVRVRGSVFNAITGKASTSCCVFLEPRDNNIALDAFDHPGHTLRQDGTFEIDNVVPGSFTLIASSLVGGKVHYGRLPVEVGDADLDDVKLTILPGVDLVGQVAFEGRQPTDRSRIQIHLEGTDSEPSMAHPATVRSDGTFTFADVSLGTYEVVVSGGPPGMYLKSVRYNGEDILKGKLQVDSGKNQTPIEIILSLAGCQFGGTVIDPDGLPVAGASVVSIPTGNRRAQYRLYRETKTDQYGRFLLAGVSPGDYKLFAWKGVEFDEWQDPDFLTPVEDKGFEMHAEENGHSSVTLTLIPII